MSKPTKKKLEATQIISEKGEEIEELLKENLEDSGDLTYQLRVVISKIKTSILKLEE